MKWDLCERDLKVCFFHHVFIDRRVDIFFNFYEEWKKKCTRNEVIDEALLLNNDKHRFL